MDQPAEEITADHDVNPLLKDLLSCAGARR
jgi:hypothetical protein